MNDLKNMTMQELVEQLKIWSNEYYNLDAPMVPDEEYDKFYDELLAREKETGIILAGSPTQKVQGEVLSSLKKVKHEVPMLSAAKSTDINEIERFRAGHNVVGSYKMDGSTVVIIMEDGKFKQAITRGSGYEGEDITHTAKMIKNLPMQIPYKGRLVIRGEAVIPISKYNEMNLDGSLGHARNCVSGGLRQLDANVAAQRNIYFYAFTLVNWREVEDIKTKINSLDFLKQNGFDVVPHELITPEEKLDDFIKKFDRTKYENFTDGHCFEYNELEYGESLGATEHHDRKLFALKPAFEAYDTTLLSIDWQVGRTGVLTPVANFTTTEINESEVSKASIHNLSVIETILGKPYIGQKIKVGLSNMIMPQIFEAEKRDDANNYIEIPKRCPVCGGETEIIETNNSKALHCTNDNCPAKLLAKFTHYVSKDCMNIIGLSEATIAQLINAGLISTYTDIYHLKDHKNEIINLEGFGEQSYNNLILAIETSRHTTLARYINALGIPNIGKSASKTLAKAFKGDVDEFLRAGSTYDYTTLDDFGEIMQQSIYSFFSMEHILDEDLVNVLEFEKEEEKEMVNNDFVNGRVFVVTGKFVSMPRKTIEQIITERGGKLASAVSAKTSYLLTNDTESGTSKNLKAKELGIPIMNEKEFLTKAGVI